MRLETEIALLNSRASDLIDTFEEKADEINQAVANAIAAAPESHRVFHVDSVEGDDSYPGTPTQKLKTINRAVDLCPVGGSVEILLENNMSYSINSVIDTKGKIISILPSNAPQDSSAYPRIIFGIYESSQSNAAYNFTTIYGPAWISFDKCHLSFDSSHNSALSNSTSLCFFQSHAVGSGSVIYFRESIVDSGDDGASVVNCHNGTVQFISFSTSFLTNSGNIVDFGNEGLAMVSINSSSKTVGAKWYDNAANVLSNV